MSPFPVKPTLLGCLRSQSQTVLNKLAESPPLSFWRQQTNERKGVRLGLASGGTRLWPALGPLLFRKNFIDKNALHEETKRVARLRGYPWIGKGARKPSQLQSLGSPERRCGGGCGTACGVLRAFCPRLCPPPSASLQSLLLVQRMR